jgi:hypothetical protein
MLSKMIDTGNWGAAKVHIAELYTKLEELEDFVRDCRDNWDCDEDAHKYNTICRCCEAKKLLSSSNK